MLKKLSLLVAFGAISVSIVLFRGGNYSFQNNYNWGSSGIISPSSKGEEGVDSLSPPSLVEEPPKIEAESVSLTRSEINERIEKQNQWIDRVLSSRSLDEEGVEKMNQFLHFFYHQFLQEGLKEHEKKWKVETIRPEKVVGRATTEDTWDNDIKYCKEVHPGLQEVGIDWQGFSGWIGKDEKSEGSVTMGRCDADSRGGRVSDGLKSVWTDEQGKITRREDKETVCHWTYRSITIKLKPELFFNHYDTWITDISVHDPEKINYRTLRIGWKGLIGTIAHELAHAAISTLIVERELHGLDEGGHGSLHDDFTKRIEKMIKSSPQHDELRNWWIKL